LECYFAGNPEALFVDEPGERYADALVELGVARSVRITCREPGWDGHVCLDSSWGRHRRGLYGFDPDFQIDGLEHGLKNVTLEIAVYIWNHLLCGKAYLVHGRVESSSRQEYIESEVRDQFSRAGRLLHESAWIPDRSGTFRTPGGVTLDDLPEGFRPDEELAAKLGMRPTHARALADALRLDPDAIQLLRDHPEETKQFLEQLRRADQAPQVHEHVAGGPHERPGQEPFEPGAPEQRAGVSPRGVVPQRRDWTSFAVRVCHPQSHEGGDDTDGARGREYVERAGVDLVLAYEQAAGREPREMPEGNPGYDLESTEALSREVRYIEIKAVSRDWDFIELTKREFECAMERGTAYWLYVVEKADQPHYSIIRIQDPARRADRFLYVSEWRALAEPDEGQAER
jgi:hypothetical protein